MFGIGLSPWGIPGCPIIPGPMPIGAAEAVGDDGMTGGIIGACCSFGCMGGLYEYIGPPIPG
jgi:hypothetical protein